MKTTARSPRTLLTLALVPLTLSLAPDEELRSSDHKKLGKEIAEWFQAKDESKGIDKAYVEISDTIDKLEKKLDKSVLSLVEDWEQAFYQARLETLTDDIRVRKGRAHEATATLPDGSEAEFGIYVPGSYNDRKGPYPLFLVVPAAGQDPVALLEEQWTDEGLLDSAILVAPKMPEDTATWNEIEGGGIARIMTLFGQIIRQFPVDMDRVYLAGYGAGASAAGRTAGLYPHLFAGLIAVDAEGAAVDPTNFHSLPTLVAGSTDADQALVASVGEMGYANCERLDAATSTEIWAWAEERTRDPYPKEIVFAPESPYTIRSHWLGLEGVDVGETRVEARVDRESNTITIDATKVATVTVYLNDLMVDMDKPVKVVVNGVSHEQLVERNKTFMLNLNYSVGDWGRVFTARVVFDVPADQTR